MAIKSLPHNPLGLLPNFSNLDAGWKILFFFLAVIFCTFILMKRIGLQLRGAALSPSFRRIFVFAPLLAPSSLCRVRTADRKSFRSLFFHAVILTISTGTTYLGYGWVIARFEPPPWMIYYLAIPILFCASELFGTLTQIAWLPSGSIVPPMHDKPFVSAKLSEFWGRRWNVSVADCFKEYFFLPLKAHRTLALLLVFIFSGLFHELVINVPLYLFTGRVFFGSMMIFFSLQAIGIFVERRFLKKTRFLNRIFLWIIVLLPAPLVFNEGLLRAFRLWPY